MWLILHTFILLKIVLDTYYDQVNDNYIIFYCAMAILYDRAVHIHVHVDWILDVLVQRTWIYAIILSFD